MNLEHLKYFMVLSECEYYRQAADRLNISQPGLSHAISNLGSELGVPLFEKVGRNIRLTQYGKILQEDAEKIIFLVEKSENTFSEIMSGGGLLRLAGITRMAIRLLPSLVKDFQTNISDQGAFSFYTGSSQEVVRGVRDGRYDVGFCFGADWKDDIEAVPFQKQGMVAIVPKDHPLASKGKITLADSLAYPQIIFSQTSSLRPSMDDFFGQIQAYPEVAYEVEQDQMIAEMVALGFGIAVMPMFPSLNQRSDLVILPIIHPYWDNTFYLIHRRGGFHSPMEKEFFQYCLSQIGKMEI